jgi:radical SAM superfamily enzyme
MREQLRKELKGKLTVEMCKYVDGYENNYMVVDTAIKRMKKSNKTIKDYIAYFTGMLSFTNKYEKESVLKEFVDCIIDNNNGKLGRIIETHR